MWGKSFKEKEDELELEKATGATQAVVISRVSMLRIPVKDNHIKKVPNFLHAEVRASLSTTETWSVFAATFKDALPPFFNLFGIFQDPLC